EYLGSTAKFLSFTGLGPDEAVLLSRAQFAIVIDGLDAQPAVEPDSKADQGTQLDLIPRIALIIETHSSAARVEQHLTSHLNLLARRIYGPDTAEIEQDYQGIKLKYFQ